MADRYWVGGSGTWNTSSTTNWSATSGGSSGASAPTATDSVFFDQAGTYTVTMTGSLSCLDFTVSAGTVSFINGTTPSLIPRGSMTLLSSTVWSMSGNLTFASTASGRTITTNGVSLACPVIFNGAGGGWTLGSALTTSNNITLTTGTLDTGNFNITTPAAVGIALNGGTCVMGSSTITCSAFSRTSAVITPGTSTIAITSSSSTFNGGGATYNNVSFTAAVPLSILINGINTFNNFSITGTRPTTAGSAARTINFSANQTINGTLTLPTAGNPSVRYFFGSNTFGTPRTITCNDVSLSDVDFRDITISGAAAPISGTRLGNLGGNTGVTFSTPKTVYRVGTNTNWHGSNSWATISGGTGSDDNYPLPQDTAIINNDTALTGILTFGSLNISNLDCSARTSAITLNHDSSLTEFHGDYILGSGVTVTGTTTQSFFKRDVQFINSSGKTIPFPLAFSGVGGTVQLAAALTLSNSVTLTRGTLSLDVYSLTCQSFATNNSNTRTLAFGTGSISITSNGTIWNINTITGLTVTGTPTVNVTNSTALGVTLIMGLLTESNAISFNITGGTYSLSYTGNCLNLDFTGFAGNLASGARTIFGNLTLSAGMSITTSSSVTTFASTAATTRTIRTNGKTIPFPISFTASNSNGTWVLQDATTITNSVTHSTGTLNLNSYILTSTSYITGAGTKNLIFNGGNLVLTNSGTAFNNSQPANFTTTKGIGNGKISMTSATAKTFIGSGGTFNCIISNDGAGALTISGNNTIDTLTNGVQPTTFLFTAGTTTTINNWNVSGVSGSLVTIGSPTAAQHTLSKSSGIVSANFLSISQSNATGGATWYAGANSTNGGNNVGWIFTDPPIGGATGNFLFVLI